MLVRTSILLLFVAIICFIWQFSFNSSAVVMMSALSFTLAPVLSRSELFYYASGSSICILASLLFLVVLINKLTPLRRAFYPLILLSLGLGTWIWTYVCNHTKTLIENYSYFILSYIATSALISLTFLYWFGPIKNERGLNIFQYALQIISIFAIWFSTTQFEVAIAIISFLLIFQFLQSSYFFLVFSKLSIMQPFITRWSYKLFPPKKKFISQREYEQQGILYTSQELEKLRSFCSSPLCNSWKYVNRLKKPAQFAKFVQDGIDFDQSDSDSHYESLSVTAYNDLESSDSGSDDIYVANGGLAKNISKNDSYTRTIMSHTANTSVHDVLSDSPINTLIQSSSPKSVKKKTPVRQLVTLSSSFKDQNSMFKDATSPTKLADKKIKLNKSAKKPKVDKTSEAVSKIPVAGKGRRVTRHSTVAKQRNVSNGNEDQLQDNDSDSSIEFMRFTTKPL